MVVHNGIVENYLPLKQQLETEGHHFETETDTEVIAHLVEKHFEGNLEEAVRRAVKQICRACSRWRSSRSSTRTRSWRRASVRRSVIGLGDGEYFVASDVPAILSHTRDMFFLADGDMAVLTPDGVHLTDFDGRPVKRQVTHILWDPIMAEKGGYKHFMLKEIFEQPRAVRDTIAGARRARRPAASSWTRWTSPPRSSPSFSRCKIIACGTSWHAALAGKFMIEKLARIPVEVDYGSEFRYRDPIVSDRRR